jgi:hypothetical protein
MHAAESEDDWMMTMSKTTAGAMVLVLGLTGVATAGKRKTTVDVQAETSNGNPQVKIDVKKSDGKGNTYTGGVSVDSNGNTGGHVGWQKEF